MTTGTVIGIWFAGINLTSSIAKKYPNINRGANLSGITWSGETDGGYIVATSAVRKFDKKYYFFPIPSEQISNSNKETAQNPGWDDSKKVR